MHILSTKRQTNFFISLPPLSLSLSLYLYLSLSFKIQKIDTARRLIEIFVDKSFVQKHGVEPVNRHRTTVIIIYLDPTISCFVCLCLLRALRCCDIALFVVIATVRASSRK